MALAHIEILGVPFARLLPQEALEHAQELFDAGSARFIAHANVHTVNLAVADPDYRAVLDRAALVLNDGKGVMLAARLLGTRFPADLNGNFFGPLLLRHAAKRGWPVFFFGAKPGVAERAAGRVVDELPDLQIAGVRHGYFSAGEGDLVAREIRATGAGLVMAGLGNPMQERWLDRHLETTGARLGIGVGAFFDFQAGEVQRAPLWMNRMGLEWVHRLAKEPKRMWRRYLVGNPQFLWRVVQQRFGRTPV